MYQATKRGDLPADLGYQPAASCASCTAPFSGRGFLLAPGGFLIRGGVSGVFFSSRPRNDDFLRESRRTFLIITCQSFAVDEKQKIKKHHCLKHIALFTNQNNSKHIDGLGRTGHPGQNLLPLFDN